MVGVAEWLRHLVVAQKTVGSNPTAHPNQNATDFAGRWSVAFLCPGLVAFASKGSYAEVVERWQVVTVSGKHIVDHLLDLCQR